jgi:hypothetical protein
VLWKLWPIQLHDALDDAGIKLKEVDGVFAATAFHSMAAMSLSEYLGVLNQNLLMGLKLVDLVFCLIFSQQQ